MRWHTLQIDWQTAEKIWQKHRTTPAEAREAFERGRVFRGPKSRHGGYTYIVEGRTYAGRPIWLLVRPLGQGIARLITAREDR